jgi:hypothetical protein
MAGALYDFQTAPTIVLIREAGWNKIAARNCHLRFFAIGLKDT